MFIVVLVTMWAVASPYYMNLRKALTEPGPDGNPTMSDESLAAQLDSRRPEILAAVGTVGLLLLVWLMVIKPGASPAGRQLERKCVQSLRGGRRRFRRHFDRRHRPPLHAVEPFAGLCRQDRRQVRRRQPP